MPIFSYEHNFVLFHIPKCGGTSLSTLVREVTNNEPFIKHTHYTYTQAKNLFHQKGKGQWFDNANKIAVVRNPYYRMISLYSYIKTHRNHYLHRRAKSWSFHEFCIYVEHLLRVDKNQDKILPCFDYVKNNDGEKQEDIRILKLEDFKKPKTINLLSTLTGVDFDKIPQMNCSFYPEENFKKSKELIKEIFKQDYEQFDY